MKASGVLFVLVAIALFGCSTKGVYCGGNNEPEPIIRIILEDYDKSVDAPPTLITVGSAKQQYPFEMFRQGIEGTAAIEGTVDSNGRFNFVAGVEATDTMFLKAAERGGRQWRFIPAKRAGLPVACAIKCNVQFSLDGK